MQDEEPVNQRPLPSRGTGSPPRLPRSFHVSFSCAFTANRRSLPFMNFRLLLAVLALSLPVATRAADESPTAALQSLVAQIKTKLQSGAETPEQLAPELAGFDALLDDIVPPLLQGVLLGQLKARDAVSQIQQQLIQGLQMNSVDVPNS